MAERLVEAAQVWAERKGHRCARLFQKIADADKAQDPKASTRVLELIERGSCLVAVEVNYARQPSSHGSRRGDAKATRARGHSLRGDDNRHEVPVGGATACGLGEGGRGRSGGAVHPENDSVVVREMQGLMKRRILQ